MYADRLNYKTDMQSDRWCRTYGAHKRAALRPVLHGTNQDLGCMLTVKRTVPTYGEKTTF